MTLVRERGRRNRQTNLHSVNEVDRTDIVRQYLVRCIDGSVLYFI